MRVLSILIALWLCLAMIGCVSGYGQFYQENRGISPQAIAARRVSAPPDTPIVEHASPNIGRPLVDAYAKRGYVIIGQSLFNSGRREGEEGAVAQARKVGADLVVILDPRYTGSITSNVPITTPTTTTSYSNASATAYGPGGPVTAYGSGTTTTYGSRTTYIPITTNRVDYGALYFVKQRFGFGVFTRELTDSERQDLQSNKGIAVRVVVDGSPAFNADVLPGDLITAIDSIPITNPQGFSEMLAQRNGRDISLSIVRRGQHIEKTVHLNP